MRNLTSLAALAAVSAQLACGGANDAPIYDTAGTVATTATTTGGDGDGDGDGGGETDGTLFDIGDGDGEATAEGGDDEGCTFVDMLFVIDDSPSR